MLKAICAGLALVTGVFCIGLAYEVCVHVMEARKVLEDMLQVLKEVVNRQKVQESWLVRISDRTDKTSNKASIVERRLEALVMTTKDTARHLHQVVQDYQVSIGGTQKMKEWVLEERALWAQARSRWQEDASEVAWDKVMALARQTLEEELEFEIAEDGATGHKHKEILEAKSKAVQLFKEMLLKGMFENTGA